MCCDDTEPYSSVDGCCNFSGSSHGSPSQLVIILVKEISGDGGIPRDTVLFSIFLLDNAFESTFNNCFVSNSDLLAGGVSFLLKVVVNNCINGFTSNLGWIGGSGSGNSFTSVIDGSGFFVSDGTYG